MTLDDPRRIAGLPPGPGSSEGPTGVAPHEVEEQAGAGLRDAFQRLYTPHRMAYIKGAGTPTAATECPFCEIPGRPDDEALIVARGEVAYAVLNLYPYNSGHLMLVPYRHVADYADLTGDEMAEIARMTQRAIRALRHASGAHGFNIGINLGAIAGAGIAAHLHQHVVPRWGGDTNFMPIVGHTRVLPALLGPTRDLLSQAWREVD